MFRRALLASTLLTLAGRAMAQVMPLLGAGYSGGPPSLNLNFLSGALPSGITFTRASIGTYLDATGTLQTASSGVARFDHNPASPFAPLGLLIEEARTNVCTNSQAISNWTKVNTTVVDNSLASPDGTVDASLCTEGVAGNATLSSVSATTASASLVTYSVYLKQGNNAWVRLLGTESTLTNGLSAWINLTTGAVAVSNRGTGTGAVVVATQLANGWWRIAATCQMPAVTTAVIALNSATASGSGTRVNNATYYAWGAQIEVGAFPTSYIPTTAAAVARAADVATITLAVNGTVAVNFIQNGNDGAAAFPRLFGDASGASNHGMFLSPTQQLGVYDGGTVNTTVNVTTLGAFAKGAATMPSGAGTGNAVLNGGAVGTVALSTGFPSTSWQFMSDSSGIDVCNGTIQAFRYWPLFLSVLEMQEVTT